MFIVLPSSLISYAFVLILTIRVVFLIGTKSLEGLRDPLKIVQIINDNDMIGFLYLSNAVPKTNVDYHYYNLKVGVVYTIFYALSQLICSLYFAIIHTGGEP